MGKKKLSRKKALKEVRALKRNFHEVWAPLKSRETSREEKPASAQFFNNTYENLNALLEFTEALLCRSSKDVFPFYLKVVDLHEPLLELLSSVISMLEFLEEGVEELELGKCLMEEYLIKLKDLVELVLKTDELAGLIKDLKKRNTPFQEVRAILGQEGKSGEEIKDEINAYLDSLEDDVALEGCLKIFKNRFKKYERELYIAYDDENIPRTNNDLEDFNCDVKRPIRKRMGKKDSWTFLEQQGESVVKYHNLIWIHRNVGGTTIFDPCEKTPLERIGLIDEVSVSSLMNPVDLDSFYRNMAENEKSFARHRWTCRIAKEGAEKCLQDLKMRFSHTI